MNAAVPRFPVVTVLLIGANLLAAFALLLNPELAYEYGFRSSAPTFQSALTSLFLHANVLHLLGNLVFLAAVGVAVELATGSARFAAVYGLSGLAGVALHYAVTRHQSDLTPLIGASGAIAGCVGYYSMRYTRLRVPIAPHLAMSVAAVTGVWVLLQIVGAFVHLGTAGGTAFWAHLGGFAAGVVLSGLLRAPDLGERRLGHEVLDRMNDRGPIAAATAARLHLERHPGDPKALEDLARACAHVDDADGEAEAILELLRVAPETEHPALLGRLVEIRRVDRLPSGRRTVLAEKFKETSPELARVLLKTVVGGAMEDTQRPEAMLALAGLEREREPGRAKALLEELLAAYPLHPCAELARKRGWVA